MSERMRILDLFCGAGGAAMGLYRAFPDAEIIGVDIKPQRNYPAFHEASYAKCFTFVQADAMEYPLEGFDFIWASPPCQAFSVMQNANVMRKDHPNLVNPIRRRLVLSGSHYVIENVPGAPLRDPHLLCGQSFGLRVLRHRLFETSFYMMTPPHTKHERQRKVRGRHDPEELKNLSYIGFTTGSVMAAFRDAMECFWMTTDEGRQAIPPAYSEYIGNQLKTVMSYKKAANR